MITSYQQILDILSTKNRAKAPKEINFYRQPIQVKQYLPMQQKIELIQFVTNIALDDTTGFISPIKQTIAEGIAILHFYAGIEFDLKQNLTEAFDVLQKENLIKQVIEAIPQEEIESLTLLLHKNLDTVQAYNTSAAGILQSFATSLNGLVDKVNEALDKMPKELKEGKEESLDKKE